MNARHLQGRKYPITPGIPSVKTIQKFLKETCQLPIWEIGQAFKCMEVSYVRTYVYAYP